MSGVSVIIPAYNNGPYIVEAIDSVLSQTTLPDEIIIVDDGSTDGTEDVVKPLLGGMVRYFRQTNQGVSAARNLGLDHALGRYIAFLDADDRWRPALLETQLQLMESEPQLICCFGNFVRFVHGSGEFLPDQFQFFPDLKSTPTVAASAGVGRVVEGTAFPAIIRWGDFPAFMLTMLFRTDRVEGLRFDRRLVRCQDADFVLRVCMRGSIGYSTAILAEVRRHGRNATSDVGMMALDKLKALECVSEDTLASQWAPALEARLLRGRFEAAAALMKRRRWRDAQAYISRAVRAPGSLRSKARGIARLGITALQSLAK